MPLEENCVGVKSTATICVAQQHQFVKRDSAMILLLGGIVFTCCPAPEFINFNARFALFAQEMFRNGPTFFPTTYNTPYPDYPAASTFLVYLMSLPLGRVTPFTVVLPTAIVSALVLVVTYQISALHSRRRAFTEPIINLTMLVVSLPVLMCRDPKMMKSAILIGFTLTAACFVVTFVCKMLSTEVVFADRVMPELWAWLPVFIFVPIAFIELRCGRSIVERP